MKTILNQDRASLNSDFSHAFDYVLRGYDPNAPHFDGLARVRNEDFLIDLDTDSMERLPDVRAYLFTIGHHTVHDLRRDQLMDPLDREQEYVRAGRIALNAERDSGRGLFLAPLDWMAMRAKEDEPSHWLDQDEPCAWMGHVIELLNGSSEEAAAFGHSGAWDPAFTHEDWRIPNGHYPATNVRAPLFPKKHMLIGPGHPDWTSLVVDLYLRHPLPDLGYTTVERYSFILAGSSKQHEWYTREIIQFYSHYGGITRHDLEGCVYCDERDLP